MSSDHYRRVLLYMILLDQGRLAAVDRWLAALYSDHYRPVLLYMTLLDKGELAAVDRWLPYTVATVHAQIMPTLCYSEHATIALYYSVNSDVY